MVFELPNRMAIYQRQLFSPNGRNPGQTRAVRLTGSSKSVTPDLKHVEDHTGCYFFVHGSHLRTAAGLNFELNQFGLWERMVMI